MAQPANIFSDLTDAQLLWWFERIRMECRQDMIAKFWELLIQQELIRRGAATIPTL